jgi:thermitase
MYKCFYLTQNTSKSEGGYIMTSRIFIISTLSICIVFLIFMISQKNTVKEYDQANLNEIHEKLIFQDVQLTEELNLHNSLNRLKQWSMEMNPSIPISKHLQDLKNQDSTIDMILWRPTSTHENEVQIGSISEPIKDKLNSFITQGILTLQQSDYASKPIVHQNLTYYVTGMATKVNQGSLIIVKHSKISQKVHAHQRKNLRLEAYPHENKLSIKTFDPSVFSTNHSSHKPNSREKSHYVEKEIVVRFQTDPSPEQLTKIKKEIQAQKINKVGYTYVFTTDQMNTPDLMKYFQKWPIVYAEPHFLYITNQQVINEKFTPNDQFFLKYQWNLPMIETIKGWLLNRGNEEIAVAIVDTGIDLQHPDIAPHLLPGQNIIDEQLPPDDDLGHGTHVAGVISALTNNDLGIAGMSWFNKVMPIKVLDQHGAGSTYAVAMGIIWATDHGAKVINLSLGNYADSAFLHDAIKYAYDHDVVMIAASGNDNSDRPSFPAAYPEVLAVGATDDKKKLATFSNYGDYVDVVAPGVNIASTYPKSQYAALSGTSMASPHVSALAALIRSTNPTLTNVQVYNIIRQSSEDLGLPGKDSHYGYGLIDVKQALQLSIANDRKVCRKPGSVL